MPIMLDGDAAPPDLVSGFLPGLPPFPVNINLIFDTSFAITMHLMILLQEKSAELELSIFIAGFLERLC